MDSKPTGLEGEDLTLYQEAEKLKADGVAQFSKKKPNKEKALELMKEALGAIDKIKNRSEQVCVLESHICQNTALIHKQNSDYPASLEMSERALKANPNNWKALINKADISSRLAQIEQAMKKGDADRKAIMKTHEAALEDSNKAMELPNADKASIRIYQEPIHLRIAALTPEKETAIMHLSKAIEIKEEPSSYFMRMRIYMALEEYQKAVEDGEAILRLDRNYMNGQFESKWLALAKSQRRKIPVTVLTGFLGSGKTTLLNRILKENHGKKIAVIENEFGAVGVDDKLVEFQEYKDEAIIEIMNGCICCTVREDLVQTILEMKKKYVDAGKIDYIIIETTGMADPAPVIQTFLLNDEIQEWCKIDSCTTICDATQIVTRLEEDREEGCENEAVEQVCFADKIFLNKIDLCTREELDAARLKIREYNTQATIEEVQFNNADIPFSKILDQDGFSIERCLELDSELLETEEQEHKHDSRIGTFSYTMEAEMTMEGANKFLGVILREKGANIYRMKGFLAIQGQERKYVFHSVGMLTSCTPYTFWEPEEKRECVFVIIGKHLEQKWLEDQFRAAALTEAQVQQIKNEHLEQHLGK